MPISRFTPSDIEKMKAEYGRGIALSKIATDFGVDRSVIRHHLSLGTNGAKKYKTLSGMTLPKFKHEIKSAQPVPGEYKKLKTHAITYDSQGRPMGQSYKELLKKYGLKKERDYDRI